MGDGAQSSARMSFFSPFATMVSMVEAFFNLSVQLEETATTFQTLTGVSDAGLCPKYYHDRLMLHRDYII